MPPELAELHAAIWDELSKAASDATHGWRMQVLATRDGEWPDARTVVVREVEPDVGALLIYTDARSPKVAQMHRHPHGMLVAWCPRLNWQLRLKARLTVQTDGLEVSSRWAALKLSPAAQDYLSPLPPGTALGVAVPPSTPDRHSRGHFGLIRAEVLGVDWTGLRSGGHRRAVFDVDGARWVTP